PCRIEAGSDVSCCVLRLVFVLSVPPYLLPINLARLASETAGNSNNDATTAPPANKKRGSNRTVFSNNRGPQSEVSAPLQVLTLSPIYTTCESAHSERRANFTRPTSIRQVIIKHSGGTFRACH